MINSEEKEKVLSRNKRKNLKAIRWGILSVHLHKTTTPKEPIECTFPLILCCNLTL